jgi:hypothetical protein
MRDGAAEARNPFQAIKVDKLIGMGGSYAKGELPL